ncbi:hypothetical protein KSP40_PGU020424 [Platanthera guangdongensis]|uniref:Uncharacterized protein n=1 Tax=Platanthera guangdongensis TaxID=2320717 RepID=A0ABR2M8M1_9ASPA
MDQVMHEMHVDGDIYLKSELTDPTSGRVYRLLRQAVQLVGIFGTFSLQDKSDDRLIIRILLQERAADVIKTVAANNWTSTCVITMKNFESLCKSPDESSAILSYLCENRKAYYFSAKAFIEGVKLSLDSSSVIAVTELDTHVLHLMWTIEKLQQQIDTVDQRLEITLVCLNTVFLLHLHALSVLEKWRWFL